MRQYTITSDKEMQIFGELIGSLVKPNDLILLRGDLGAGKTTLTKGIARSLGIRRPVKSPTFTIVREYREGRIPLFHMDMYRLEDGDTESVDLDGYFKQNGVVIMEWPNFVSSELPTDFLSIEITRNDEDLESTTRVITLNASGDRYKFLLSQIEQEY